MPPSHLPYYFLFLLTSLVGVVLSQQPPPPAPAPPPLPAAPTLNDTLCEQFSRSDGSDHHHQDDPTTTSSSSSSNNIFTSPLYPNKYPPRLQCIRVIEAPPGHVIRLHFLETFLVEHESSCRYDYLEIRDGQFGYSTMIGKLCGDTPPSYIESSGRHLWLRFNSDNDIEYVGFKVQYTFISTVPPGSSSHTPSDIACSTKFINVMEGWLNSSEIPDETILHSHSLGTPIDCTWVIEAKEDEKIYLQFFHYSLAAPNDCESNFVEVYGGKTELEGDEGRIKHFCGSEAEAATSKKNTMHVRFLAGVKTDTKDGNRIKPDSSLEAYFSVFRELKEGQTCVANKEFDCTDNSCIDFKLRCNGKANCKLRNDEEGCDQNKGRFKLTTDILIISFLGILLMAGMCSGLLLNIYRKLREDKLWPGGSGSNSSAGGGSNNNQRGGGGGGDAEDPPVVHVMHPPNNSSEDNNKRESPETSASSGAATAVLRFPPTSTSSCPPAAVSSMDPPMNLRRVEVRDTGCQATPTQQPLTVLPLVSAHAAITLPAACASASAPPQIPTNTTSPRRKTQADILVLDN